MMSDKEKEMCSSDEEEDDDDDDDEEEEDDDDEEDDEEEEDDDDEEDDVDVDEEEEEEEDEDDDEEEEEEEREMVEHWSHEHPLTLVETRRRRDQCYGCEQPFSSGEQAYGCSIKGCKYSKLLHEECVAMARKIRHPLHPQHILIQRHARYLLSECEFCGSIIWSIGYKCTSSRCKFQMHLSCAQGGGMMDITADDDDDDDDNGDEQRLNIIRHPSHSKHELKLWRRRCSFKCDACGTMRRGSSYTCITDACQYWIHERCASLPLTIKREDHHHSLSLYFHVPHEYIVFHYKCDVCSKSLLPKNWIYHCQLCRYIVHIKCAFNKPPYTTEYVLL